MIGASSDLETAVSTAISEAASPSDPQALLAQRNRDPSLPAPPAWNAVLETILNHRSVRGFLPKSLEPGTLELLVAAAQSASTSSNLQVWSVIAVEDPERKSRVATLAGNQQFIRDAPLLLVWLADLARTDSIGADRQIHVEGTQYLEAFILGIVDAALAAQSALLAAESIGLGGVYVGAMRNHPEKVAAELGLPPNVFAVFGMAIGWPDPARLSTIKPRLPQSVVLHREQYDTSVKREAIEQYNATARDFMREQGMKEQDWTAQALGRLRSAETLTGRDRMREALSNMGFGLR
jgi:nitroreductase